MKRKVLKDLFWAAFKFVFAIKNCGIILICVLKRKSVPFIANLVSLSLRKIPSYSVLLRAYKSEYKPSFLVCCQSKFASWYCVDFTYSRLICL